MRPAPFVKIKVMTDLLSGFARGIVSMQRSMLILHSFPEPRQNKHIVPSGALALHTDVYAIVLEIWGIRMQPLYALFMAVIKLDKAGKSTLF